MSKVSKECIILKKKIHEHEKATEDEIAAAKKAIEDAKLKMKRAKEWIPYTKNLRKQLKEMCKK